MRRWFRRWLGLLPAISLVLTGCHSPVSVDQPATQVHPGHGIVETISPDRHLVTIHHQAIPGYMMEMTMDFPVRDSRLLDGIAVGDRIDFTLAVTGDDAWISGVRRTGQADLAAIENQTVSPTPILLRPGEPLPDAELVSETGRPLHLSDFRGRAVALTFFFTRCPLPTYCPLMNRNFAQARALLLAQAKAPRNWQLLSISFDPDFDTPQALTSYALAFRGLNADRWLFATVTPKNLAILAGPLGLIVMRQGAAISHNLRTVVIDPQGRLFRQFNDNTWTPRLLADAIIEAARQ